MNLICFVLFFVIGMFFGIFLKEVIVDDILG